MEENGQLVKFLYNEDREASPMSSMVRTRKAENSHRRMYSHVYSTTMNTMHSAIPSDVKNRYITVSVIQESSTIL